MTGNSDHGIRRHSGAAALVLSACIIVFVVVLTFTRAFAGSEESAADTDFQISVAAGTGTDPQPHGSGTEEDPIIISLVDPLSSGSQHWTITVKSLENNVGRLKLKFIDPDPNMKIKNKMLPTPNSDGTDKEHYQYYPDLFTQLRFTVSDEQKQLWTGKLGTDGPLNPNDPGANNAQSPGWLSSAIRLRLDKGQSKTYSITAYVDSSMSNDTMSAYNGTTTKLGLVVKGETR